MAPKREPGPRRRSHPGTGAEGRGVGIAPELVGLGGFEPPTSPLSGVRSDQLSYRPEVDTPAHRATPSGHAADSGCSIRQFVVSARAAIRGRISERR